MKLNNRGMTIVEIVITFTIIMFLLTGLLVMIVNYRNKAAVSLERLKMDTFKDNLTQDIYNDILTKGVKKIEENPQDATDLCNELNKCLVITFYDDTKSSLGVKTIDYDDKSSVENKYIYYDGLGYKLKDNLPNTKPANSSWRNIQQITINDDNLLEENSTVLEDGTKVSIYKIDISVSHIDFSDDFGIHIVASTDNISL